MRRSRSLGDLVRQTVHTATGVPRLYAAAMGAGAGPRGSLEALRISEVALRTAATSGAGVPGRTNAVRHFVWQALLTARLGPTVAQALAAAQESGSTRRHDSRVDAHNNAQGQAHGAAHAEELRATPLDVAVRHLVPVALAKWETGDLVWVRPT